MGPWEPRVLSPYRTSGPTPLPPIQMFLLTWKLANPREQSIWPQSRLVQSGPQALRTEGS